MSVPGLVVSPLPSNCANNVPVCMGIDEAGRGPVLGDMVYGGAYWPISENEELAKLGFMDSKMLTPGKREELFRRLKDSGRIGYITHSISAIEISAKMQKRSPISLNAMSHASALGLVRAAIAAGANVEEVYVDTVGSSERYQEYLSKAFQDRIKFTVTKKADSLFPVVSAASIAAKVTRDKGMETWVFKEPGLAVVGPLGSGYPGDEVTKTWLQKNMNPVFGFSSLVRFSWQTTETILERDAAPVTWDGDEVGSGISAYFSSTPQEKRCGYFKKMRLEKVTTL